VLGERAALDFGMVTSVNRMRRWIGWTLLALGVCASGARAQSDRGVGQPMAAASPRGVWVFLGPDLATQRAYAVSRSSSDAGASAVKVGDVSAPASREELARRVQRFAPYFDGLAPVTDAEMDRMWQQVQSGKPLEKFIPVNLPVAHLAFGTAFLDTTVTPGTYRYRVEGGPRGAAVDTRDVRFPVKVTLAAVSGPTASFDGRRVNVRWPLPSAAAAAGMIVTRRVGLRGDFVRYRAAAGFSAGKDGTFVVVSDAGVESGTAYEYVVSLVDAFGNRGAPSSAARVGTFPANAAPTVTELHAEDAGSTHGVRLTWKLTGDAYVRSIALERSAAFDGPYAVVATLAPGTGETVDIVPDANEAVYYRLVIDGVNGESAPSAAVPALSTHGDTPLAPVDVRTEATDAGVRVSWRGIGPHIIGYYVYRSDGPHGTWEQISSMVPAVVPVDTARVSAVDTTRNRGLKLYYAVRAVGDTYALSPLSDFDVAPWVASHAPPIPSNLRSVIDDGKVMLFWDDLSEREPMLAGYDVFRRAGADRPWTRVHRGGFAPRTNYWTDSTAVVGTDYEYGVQSVDVAGDTSTTGVPLAVRVPDAPPLPVPDGVRAARAQGGIYIGWSAPDDTRVTGYRLYRAEPGGTPTRIASPKAAEHSFVDTDARVGHVYVYTLTAVTGGATEGASSTPVTIRR
jgi:fibronectin type 3 domain-containing protein